MTPDQQQRIADDLNAMHSAVKLLTSEQRRAYRFHLRNLCGTYEEAIDATAAQRAEAFIKVFPSALP